MRYLMIAAALAAVSTAAQGQNSVWGSFDDGNGSSGVGVQSPNGTQLLLKCDKPGRGEVYATLVSKEPLAPPSNTRFVMRPVELRFDDGAPIGDRWRFYEQTATAVNQKSENQLERLVTGLANAKSFRARLNPDRARWVELSFDVSGAKAAIQQVYESCKDDNPLG